MTRTSVICDDAHMTTSVSNLQRNQDTKTNTDATYIWLVPSLPPEINEHDAERYLKVAYKPDGHLLVFCDVITQIPTFMNIPRSSVEAQQYRQQIQSEITSKKEAEFLLSALERQGKLPREKITLVRNEFDLATRTWYLVVSSQVVDESQPCQEFVIAISCNRNLNVRFVHIYFLY